MLALALRGLDLGYLRPLRDDWIPVKSIDAVGFFDARSGQGPTAAVSAAPRRLP